MTMASSGRHPPLPVCPPTPSLLDHDRKPPEQLRQLVQMPGIMLLDRMCQALHTLLVAEGRDCRRHQSRRAGAANELDTSAWHGITSRDRGNRNWWQI